MSDPRGLEPLMAGQTGCNSLLPSAMAHSRFLSSRAREVVPLTLYGWSNPRHLASPGYDHHAGECKPGLDDVRRINPTTPVHISARVTGTKKA
jgi:hypothetical protein